MFKRLSKSAIRGILYASYALMFIVIVLTIFDLIPNVIEIGVGVYLLLINYLVIRDCWRLGYTYRSIFPIGNKNVKLYYTLQYLLILTFLTILVYQLLIFIGI